MITADELPALLKEGGDVVEKLVRAGRVDSPGGRKITPAERDAAIREGLDFLAKLGRDILD